MKKVLLFIKDGSLKPIGGPRGYLYNLMSGVSKIKSNTFEVHLLKNTNSDSQKKARSFYDRLPLWIKTIYRVYGHWQDYKILTQPIKLEEDINDYNYIHFHDCFNLYRAKELLQNYNGTVLLTSHCPKPPQLEKVEDLYSSIEQKILGKRHLSKYTECVKYAFNRADCIIFPCEEAEESYIKNWIEYESIREKRKSHIKYLPTGLKDCREKEIKSREEIRKKYGIPEDAIVLSFVGRHNKVKGYDRLRSIGHMLENNKNIYVIVAGEEFPLTRPRHPRWIEVGWTNDPYSIINASDIFILPNEETYFDLVLIEILSLGKAAIISRTGGNKYFENLSDGIKLFETEQECTDIVKQLASSPEIIKDMGNKNRHLYESKFTDVEFANGYFRIISGET